MNLYKSNYLRSYLDLILENLSLSWYTIAWCHIWRKVRSGWVLLDELELWVWVSLSLNFRLEPGHGYFSLLSVEIIVLMAVVCYVKETGGDRY